MRDIRAQATQPADESKPGGESLLLGVIPEWLVLGPYDITDVSEAMDKAFVSQRGRAKAERRR